MRRVPNPGLALKTDLPSQPADHAACFWILLRSRPLGSSPLQLLIGIFTLTYEQAGGERMEIFKPHSQNRSLLPYPCETKAA